MQPGALASLSIHYPPFPFPFVHVLLRLPASPLIFSLPSRFKIPFTLVASPAGAAFPFLSVLPNPYLVPPTSFPHLGALS